MINLDTCVRFTSDVELEWINYSYIPIKEAWKDRYQLEFVPSGSCLKCLQFGSVHLKVGVMGYRLRVDGCSWQKWASSQFFRTPNTHWLLEQCSLSWQSGGGGGGQGGPRGIIIIHMALTWIIIMMTSTKSTDSKCSACECTRSNPGSPNVKISALIT